jgi:alkylation response protein AidB-like acyl-CoA dehydrogenase
MSAVCTLDRAVLHAFGLQWVRPTLQQRDEAAVFEPALWLRLAATGLFASARRGSAVEAAQALAGLAEGGLDLPLALSAAAQWIGVFLLHAFGNTAQKARYLDAAISGECILAVCNSEQETGTKLRAMRSSVIPTSDGGHLLSLSKSAASNLPLATAALCSAWKYGDDSAATLERTPNDLPKMSLEVFLVPVLPPLQVDSHVGQLAGFRTGLTGALSLPAAMPLMLEDSQLGPDHSGVRILRSCFHLERLLIGALISGGMDGIFHDCVQHLRQREAREPQFVQNQYVQEKLTLLYTLSQRVAGIWRLIEDAMLQGNEAADPAAKLEHVSALLGVLKLTAVEDSLLAAETAYELHGYAGYHRASLSQKLHRDLLAFKMLGGSKELMKISLFRDLRASWERSSA